MQIMCGCVKFLKSASFRNSVDRDVQKRAFRSQLELAKEVGKPVVIHCRGVVDGVWDDAEADCLQIMKEVH